MYNYQEQNSDWKSYHYDYTQSPFLDIKEIEKNNSQNKTSLIAEFKRFSPSVKEFKKILTNNSTTKAIKIFKKTIKFSIKNISNIIKKYNIIIKI